MSLNRLVVRGLFLAGLMLLIASPVAFARGKKAEPKPEPKYPNASRVDPEPKPSRGVNKQLNKMFELSQEDGKVDEVLALAEEILNHPKAGNYDRAIAAQTAAYQWMEKDDYPKAIQYLQRAIDENALPNDTHFTIMLQIAQMQQAEDQLQAASATLKRLMDETKSDNPEIIGLQGSIYYQQEHCAEAIPVLKDAIAKAEAKGTKQQSAWSQILMACYSELEQPENAIELAKQLAAKDPDNIKPIQNLATVYLQAEKYAEATQVLEDAKNRGLLTTEKDYEQLYTLYHYAEQEDKAIATVKEGLEKGILPPSEKAYKVVAEAYYLTERSNEAIDWYGKAAELSSDGESYLNQARLMYENDRYSEAKAAANKALSRSLRRPGDAWIIIGSSEIGLKNRDAGIAAYRKAASYPETKKMAESWLRASGVR